MTVQALAKEGLISKEEHDKLLKKDTDLELKSIASIKTVQFKMVSFLVFFPVLKMNLNWYLDGLDDL